MTLLPSLALAAALAAPTPRVGVVHGSASYALSDAPLLADGARRLETMGVEVIGVTLSAAELVTPEVTAALAPFSVVVARLKPGSEKEMAALAAALGRLHRDGRRTIVLMPEAGLAKDPAATLRLARAVRAARSDSGAPVVLAATEVKNGQTLRREKAKAAVAAVDLVGLDASHLVARQGEGDATLAGRVRRAIEGVKGAAPRAFVSRFGREAAVIGRARAWQHARIVAGEAIAAGLPWALYDGLYDRKCQSEAALYRPGGGGRATPRSCEGRALVAWSGEPTTAYDALLPFWWPATTEEALARLFARYRAPVAAEAAALRGRPDLLPEVVARLRAGAFVPALTPVQATEPDQSIRLAAVPVAGSGRAPLLLGAGLGAWPELRTADATQPGALVFPADWRGGVRVAVARARNGVVYHAVGAGPGREPVVRLFANGAPLAAFLPYDAQHRGGVYVALGDVSGDGIPDLVTGPGPGHPPRVRAFDLATGALLRDFMPPFGDDFPGGVRVAAGDLDGDGRAELVTAPGPGGGPIVSVYAGKDNAQLLHTYGLADRDHRGGLYLAVGRFTADGPALMVVGSGTAEDEGPNPYPVAGEPRVRALRLDGSFAADILALDRGRSVRVATTDFDGDGLADLVVCTGADDAPFARVTKGLSGEELAIVHPPGGEAFRGGCHPGGAHAP